jgi:hypothetical protein
LSSFAYGALTRKRQDAQPQDAQPRDGTSPAPPGVGTYLDALTALVPAEVLSAHAVILTFTTKATLDAQGQAQTTISARDPLVLAFWVLMLFSVLLYFAGLKRIAWGWDLAGAAIPPLAFLAWTMLQKATAFDAIAPGMDEALRSVIAILLATFLGGLAIVLAQRADAQSPSG